MESNQSYILKAVNITKIYQSGPEIIEVLKGLDFQIAQKEIIVIMGPSGVGKSTLLNIIGTLDKPTNGELFIDGNSVFNFNEQKLSKFRNAYIGFIFQFHHLLPEFTAIENVMIPRMIKDDNWKDDEEKAVKLLTDVGLAHRLSHRPNQLSGGEQQRVAVARALMNQPKLILADEPTGDLDIHSSEALFELIIELNEKYNQSFIIVTHNEMFAKRAHRVIQLWDGKIVEEHQSAI
jgi:lipoprotein-releasing system ATP-binding protein